MADNIELNAGSGGATVRTDDVGGIQQPTTKLLIGPDGSDPRVVEDADGVPVKISSDTFVGDSVGGVFTFMTDDGLPVTGPVATSNANANVDGSVTPQYFYFAPPAGFGARITRLIVTIKDAGTLDSGSYGNGITLSNGIRVLIGTNAPPVDPLPPANIIFDLTAALPVFTNTDWGRYTVDLNFSNFGAGDEVMTSRWDTGTVNRGRQFDGLALNGDAGDWFAVEIADDLTNLIEHLFFVQGVIGAIPGPVVGAAGAGL